MTNDVPTSAEGWLAKRQAEQRRSWEVDEKTKIRSLLARTDRIGKNATRIAMSLLDSGMSYEQILRIGQAGVTGCIGLVHRRSVMRGNSALMERRLARGRRDVAQRGPRASRARMGRRLSTSRKSRNPGFKTCARPRLRSDAWRLDWPMTRRRCGITTGNSGSRATTSMRSCKGEAPRPPRGFGREGDTMVTRRIPTQEEAEAIEAAKLRGCFDPATSVLWPEPAAPMSVTEVTEQLRAAARAQGRMAVLRSHYFAQV